MLNDIKAYNYDTPGTDINLNETSKNLRFDFYWCGIVYQRVGVASAT